MGNIYCVRIFTCEWKIGSTCCKIQSSLAVVAGACRNWSHCAHSQEVKTDSCGTQPPFSVFNQGSRPLLRVPQLHQPRDILRDTSRGVSPDSESRQVDDKRLTDITREDSKHCYTVHNWLKHSLLCIHRRPWNQLTPKIVRVRSNSIYLKFYLQFHLFIFWKKERKARKSFSRCYAIHEPCWRVSIFCFLEDSFLYFQNFCIIKIYVLYNVIIINTILR